MKRETIIKLMRTAIRIVGTASPQLAGAIALKIFTSPRRHARPEWEQRILASAKPMTLNGNLRAYSWGNGPRVLLVHGWEGRGTQLGHLVQPLVDAGYQAIALDGPAHGDSPGERTNIHFFADNLVKVGQELGPLHAVVAHSFGGGATMLALSRGLRAKRVVSVAAPSNIQRVVDTFAKAMGLSRPVATEMQKQLESWAGIKIADLDIIRITKSLDVPALIVHDPEDREVAFMNAEAIAGSWEKARLLTLPKVGHRRVLKLPVFLNAVMAFLEEEVASSDAASAFTTNRHGSY